MKEPTMQEVLELVEFDRDDNDDLFVTNVKGSVKGYVRGYVWGVDGHVFGRVDGDVFGDVVGNVEGTISGREWQFVETPKQKAIRLIREGRGEEAIDVLEISGVCGD